MPKKTEKTNPIEPFEPRKYVCSRWPFLHLGMGIRFENGFYEATDQEHADRVEANDGFGRSIIRVKQKPRAKMSVEESAEYAALDELKKLKPKVHRGMVGTRTSEVG